MAFRSEQARVLNRQLIGGLIRNLVVFTAVLGVCAALYQFFINPLVAEEVADMTAPWHVLDSSDEFNTIMRDEGFIDNNIFYTVVNGLVPTDFVTEGEGAITMGDEEIAAALIAAGYYDYFRVFLYLDETAAAKDVDNVANSGINSSVAAAVSGGEDNTAYDEALKKETTSKALDMADEGNLRGVYALQDLLWNEYSTTDWDYIISEQPDVLAAFFDYIANSPLPEQVLETAGLTRDTSSERELCGAYILALLIDESGLKVTLPAGIVSKPTEILMTAAYYGGTQEVLDANIHDAYMQSQDLALQEIESLSKNEQQVALKIPSSSFVLQVQKDPTGTYQYRDVSTYNLIKSFKLPLLILIFVVGWFVIVATTLHRSLKYFDDLSNAVASLLTDKTASVKLPKSLSIAQNELAVIRAQSLADERAAKAAEQRKNELVAYLAHDIRTPLTSVLGYLDLLRETTDLPRDTQRKYSDIAYSKAERLEDLINEFFEITRYNLSAIPIERQTVGVRLFCEQIAESFYPDALARSVDISISTKSADRFFVDPDKLARAVGNVLRNALTYAEPKSTIFLSAHNVGEKTIMTISNHGREISAAHLETIFEKFYREDGSRSSRSGGAGLGLAIAREIVTAHGGTIAARSEEGVTTFTIELPSGQVKKTGLSATVPPIEVSGVPVQGEAPTEKAQRPARVTTQPKRRSGASPSRPLSILNQQRGAHQGKPSLPLRDNTGQVKRRRSNSR